MRESESLDVVWRPIGKVHPYPGNPRQISEAAIEKVANSLKEFGWRQPIVVDEKGEVVVGHTRLLAARKLRRKRVPVHVARGLTPEQIRAYRLADNRTHDEARWDPKALELELKGLGAADFDLKLTAFDPIEFPREPTFEPAGAPTSKPLDHLTEITCPKCGHVFETGARR
jgi:ParB-like chromosome segregation protein Spo0J